MFQLSLAFLLPVAFLMLALIVGAISLIVIGSAIWHLATHPDVDLERALRQILAADRCVAEASAG